MISLLAEDNPARTIAVFVDELDLADVPRLLPQFGHRSFSLVGHPTNMHPELWKFHGIAPIKPACY
jgi:hypothetical protein